jgi:hypothetical protein
MSHLYGEIIKQEQWKEINDALFKWPKSRKMLESHILLCVGHSLNSDGCMRRFP